MRLINKRCPERLGRDETDLQPLRAGFNMGCTQFPGEGGGSLCEAVWGGKSVSVTDRKKNKVSRQREK